MFIPAKFVPSAMAGTVRSSNRSNDKRCRALFPRTFVAADPRRSRRGNLNRRMATYLKRCESRISALRIPIDPFYAKWSYVTRERKARISWEFIAGLLTGGVQCNEFAA